MRLRLKKDPILQSCYYYYLIILLNRYVDAYINDALNPIITHEDVWKQRLTRVAVPSKEGLQCERPHLYICEEPSETIPSEETKYCNYRNVKYHEQIYRWVAGRGCLLFTPDFLYKDGVNTINLNAGCFYGDLFAPCLEIAKSDGTCGCYPFDPALEEVATAVRAAIITSAHGRWEDCFYTALDCCSHVDQTSDNNATECDVTFDGWTCWPNTLAGSTAYQVCSEFAYSNAAPSCDLYSSKVCYSNGSWEIHSEYSTCSVTPRLLRRYRFYIGVIAFSVATTIPALLLFFLYEKLRITPVALHRNLILAILIRDLMVIFSRSEIYLDELTNAQETVMTTHSIACRLLTVSEKLAENAVFVCMLVEGIYLHRLVAAGSQDKMNLKMFYGFGALVTILPVMAWSAVMYIRDNHSCWLIYTAEYTQWIVDGPKIAMLLVNTGLFIDILRILLVKTRNIDDTRQLNTGKATVFLMPLFGIQFLLTALRPNTANCTWEQFYFYVSYLVQGLQGLIVALLYCYVNKEVHILVKETYIKTEAAIVTKVRRDPNYYQRPTLSGLSETVTVTPSYNNIEELNSDKTNDDKNPYASVKPKQLHVAEIISIQGTEKLADMLEPVYETIDHGIENSAYDIIDRSDMDGDSGFIMNRESKVEDYYGFTNASSVSIECQDWIRCISSPSSSVYNNSLNDYEIKYLERKFPNQRLKTLNETCKPDLRNKTVIEIKDDIEEETISPTEIEECATMFNEIMQYIETSEKNSSISDNNTQFTNDDDTERTYQSEDNTCLKEQSENNDSFTYSCFKANEDDASDHIYVVPRKIEKTNTQNDKKDTNRNDTTSSIEISIFDETCVINSN